jgi:hypothetical protein
MPVANLKILLLWSLALNYGVLLTWVLVIVFGHDTLHRMSARLFRVSAQTFDVVNYSGIAAYKCCIIFFNLVPWLALSMTT